MKNRLLLRPNEVRAVQEFMDSLTAARDLPLEEFSEIAREETRKLRGRVRPQVIHQMRKIMQERRP